MFARTTYLFRNGKTAPNRIVVPAMASQTADGSGIVTPATIAHYQKLSTSGAGIIFVEYSFVHQSGKAEPNQLGIASDAHKHAAAALASAVKSNGALAGFQIAHAGARTSSAITGSPLMSPSGVVVPTRNKDPEIPAAMSMEQILEWKKWFVDAALRAQGAGFDIVELHAAHGYGLGQWLSPLTNRRTDSYGSQDRLRLVREIVCEIKQTAPDLLISIRIPGNDFLDNGLDESEMQSFAQELEKAGADILNVSSGIGGWNKPAAEIDEGFLVPQAAAIQSQVKIPVIGVGGIKSLDFVNRGIERNDFQFAAIGRAILHGQWNWK
jgi:NADPH2 dehydrogenase